MVTLVTLITLMGLVLVRMIHRGQKQLHATQEMCAAQELFMLWRAEHQNRSTEESPLGEQIF